MISYQFTKYADRQLRKLSVETQRKIIKKLRFYLGCPNPLSFAKFLRRKGGVKSYRFRIGNFRIIFDWEEKSILITKILPRKFKGIYK